MQTVSTEFAPLSINAWKMASLRNQIRNAICLAENSNESSSIYKHHEGKKVSRFGDAFCGVRFVERGFSWKCHLHVKRVACGTKAEMCLCSNFTCFIIITEQAHAYMAEFQCRQRIHHTLIYMY